MNQIGDQIPAQPNDEIGLEPRESETFASPDTDVVLLSNDCVAFKVYRLFLVQASPFFQTLFSLPQPPSSEQSAVPTVNVHETSEIIDLLLRYIYPLAKPKPNLRQIRDLPRVTDKYEMDWIQSSLRTTLVSEVFLYDNPVQVFLISSLYNLHDEARIACRRALEVDLITMPLHELDLEGNSGCYFARLFQLHQSRARLANDILRKYTPPTLICRQCYDGHDCPRWWRRYFLPKAREDLLRRPISKGLFSTMVVTKCMAASGCTLCWQSIRVWQTYFAHLTLEIDALPTKIDDGV
jgi:hypothetical protein